MRRLLLVSVLVLFPGTFSLSQQKSGAPDTAFTATTELVLVPASVSEHGKHVSNLSRDDFSISYDGHEAKIAYFEEIRREQRTAVPAPKDIFTNYVGKSGSTAQLTIFAIDLVNLPFLSQATARSMILSSLAKLPEDGDPKALVVFTPTGIKVLHDFTTNPDDLSRALRKLVFRTPDLPGLASPQVAGPRLSGRATDSVFQRLTDFAELSSSQYNEFQQRRLIESTNECLRQIAVGFTGVPGRKALVWATGGAPFQILSPVVSGADNTLYYNASGEMVSDYERTWRMLNAANVAVYPIDVRDPEIPYFADASEKEPPTVGRELARRSNRDQGTTMMKNIAEETGGVACVERNDPSGCFREAVDDSGSYYMIGFYLNRKTTKPGWHALNVRTTAKNTNVRARAGFAVPDPRQKPDPTSEMREAMISPLDYTGVPMTARWTGMENGNGGKNVANFELKLAAGGFEMDQDDGNHINLEVSVVLRKYNGDAIPVTVQKLEARFKPQSAAQIRRDGFVYRNKIEIASGDHVVRFIVRDKLTGRMGSVSAPLTINEEKVQKGS